MRFHWHQLSPKEKEAMLQFFVLHRQAPAPVTAEQICAAMRRTHHLSCHAAGHGTSVYEFVPGKTGEKPGAAVSDDLTEGIYKAALRATGVEIEDGLGGSYGSPQRTKATRAIRAVKKN